MHLNNTILSTLDIDSSEFFYKSSVTLYDEKERKPYGKVTFKDGRYHLAVGNDIIQNNPTTFNDY